ncbi:putative DEAD/DEAH box helicase [Neospora caninum Liverpool]|uniref:ATP-dependent RNA helicase n=1 Tax=Neospora caninum (strain Liverpool) TaxID=572307 RepID=F0VEC6_NEOCL|nr:putative DEAD/DEAH box helicase [Neospora caninum Liverpool]CBZ52070.1 putative DEAD/DEAH box helicase [Neospora caninum Liverpool]CEL66031.1 TPA: DEAD/DEAH box helicase, putative [Neospora caninum Liverpool]|eukprot:XP_003882102.1 putative DEAD/DEAH box helicase [Neospora caninum Liverpool]
MAKEKPRRGGGAASRGGKKRKEFQKAPCSGKLRQKEQQEIRELEDRICVEMPLPGLSWQPTLLHACLSSGSGSASDAHPEEKQPGSAEAPDAAAAAENPAGTPTLSRFFFSDLPLSQYTRRGLKDGGFHLLSSIQARAIPHALRGADILGEAKTGSGKTLCFVIPVLECLYRNCVSSIDGLAALILAPTRELAVQIFDVIKLVGRHHEFSAGCLIGGKSVQAEAQRVNALNIVVGTPGRVLQHMEESQLWEASGLKILVIDEADRLVDMGFFETSRMIISQLPTSRQSLLFSATLKSAVKRLAALAASTDAERISVDPGVSATPVSLRQSYVVVPAQHKLSALFSFLRTHSSKKILVFVSSCKQTRFLYEALRILKPGVTLMYLHGRQKQQKRLEVFQSFVERSGECCLISTDLASRGIDFTQLSLFTASKLGPTGFSGKRRAREEDERTHAERRAAGQRTGSARGRPDDAARGVDFVVQLDCPDSVETYIHRVGRTARMQRKGQALLMILPSEVQFVDRLRDKKIEMKQLFMNPKKAVRVENKLQSILAQNTALKILAQQALTSYLRCVALMPDKTVFSLPTEKKALTALANAYGLSLPPNVTLLVDEKARPQKGGEAECGEGESSVSTGGAVAVTEMKKKKNLSKLERLKEKIRQKKAEKEARRQTQSLDTETREAGETETLVEVESAAEIKEKKGRANERRRERFEEPSEGGQDDDAAGNLDDDGLLVLKDTETANLDEKDKGRLLHEQLMRKPGYRREQLRFRADGTAKVKGLAAASLQQSHVFFGDEEGDEEEERDSGDSGDKGDWGGDDEGEEGSGDLPSASGRAAFLQRMRKKVLAAQQGDKERHRQRIHELHTRQRQKARARRQAQAAEQGNAPQAVLDLRNSPWEEDEESAEEREGGEEEDAEQPGGRRVARRSSSPGASDEECEETRGEKRRKADRHETGVAGGGGSKRQRRDRVASQATDDGVPEEDLEALALQVLQGKAL